MPRWDAVGFFCEDIRQEINGVETIIGVMPDNVAIDGTGFMPKLCTYVRVHVSPDIDVDAISVTIDFFDGEHLQMIGSFARDQIQKEKEGARNSEATLIGFIFRGVMTPFPVPHPGPIRLRAKVGSEEIICGGIRLVSASNSPNVPRQPS